MTKISLVILLFFGAVGFAESEEFKNNIWYKYNDSDTAFVFVHGIFSNSNNAWRADNGAYWPTILANDPRFKGPSIFLGGYYTAAESGIFAIPDAADQLWSHLSAPGPDQRPAPLSKKNLVFVAHSTGGLVVRYLIDRHSDDLRDKTIGLMLVASPSRGSEWSNRLSWLHKFYGNKMAGELAVDNELIMDLDRRFADLVANKEKLRLTGIDVFENKFLIPGPLFSSDNVVSAKNSASYFGAPRIIPNSDHFTIVKPDSINAEVHQTLWAFFYDKFLPLTKESSRTSEAAKLLKLTLRLKISPLREKPERTEFTATSGPTIIHCGEQVPIAAFFDAPENSTLGMMTGNPLSKGQGIKVLRYDPPITDNNRASTQALLELPQTAGCQPEEAELKLKGWYETDLSNEVNSQDMSIAIGFNAEKLIQLPNVGVRSIEIIGALPEAPATQVTLFKLSRLESMGTSVNGEVSGNFLLSSNTVQIRTHVIEQ